MVGFGGEEGGDGLVGERRLGSGGGHGWGCGEEEGGEEEDKGGEV